MSNLNFNCVKILDIGYTIAIYVVLATIISVYIDKKLGEFDPKEADKKSTYRLIGECMLHFWLIAVLTYFARNLVKRIPSPFDGIHGFKHTSLQEIKNAAIFMFILLFFQDNLHDKLRYIQINRLK